MDPLGVYDQPVVLTRKKRNKLLHSLFGNIICAEDGCKSEAKPEHKLCVYHHQLMLFRGRKRKAKKAGDDAKLLAIEKEKKEFMNQHQKAPIQKQPQPRKRLPKPQAKPTKALPKKTGRTKRTKSPSAPAKPAKAPAPVYELIGEYGTRSEAMKAAEGRGKTYHFVVVRSKKKKARDFIFLNCVYEECTTRRRVQLPSPSEPVWSVSQLGKHELDGEKHARLTRYRKLFRFSAAQTQVMETEFKDHRLLEVKDLRKALEKQGLLAGIPEKSLRHWLQYRRKRSRSQIN